MSELKFLIWPSLILILCLLFREPITKLISSENTVETRIEVGVSGVKIIKIAKSVAEIAVNTLRVAQENNSTIDQSALASNLATGIELSLANKPNKNSDNSILWVDDTPSNNAYLVSAFEELGIKVDIAKSTSEAETQLSGKIYNIVITDMYRPPVDEAGLELIAYINKKSIKTQVIIYAAKWAEMHKGQEATTRSALITNNPSEVYSKVIKTFLSFDR